MMGSYSPPTALRAEQAVLGVLLHAPASEAGAVRCSMKSNHFADPIHASIFQAAIRLLDDNNGNLDLGDLATKISAALDEVGGRPYLDHLKQVRACPEGTEPAISAIREAWAWRELIALGSTVSEIGVAAVADAFDSAGTSACDQAGYFAGRLRGVLTVLDAIAELRS